MRRRLIDTRFDEPWLDSHPGDRRLAEMMEARESGRGPGFSEQLEARRGHDTWDRLGAIACPTSIGCGRFDGIAPPRTARPWPRGSVEPNSTSTRVATPSWPRTRRA